MHQGSPLFGRPLESGGGDVPPPTRKALLLPTVAGPPRCVRVSQGGFRADCHTKDHALLNVLVARTVGVCDHQTCLF